MRQMDTHSEEAMIQNIPDLLQAVPNPTFVSYVPIAIIGNCDTFRPKNIICSRGFIPIP